ncbi:MAG: helix-turn-helix domain-containing protein [Lachnospiraceae bacterium]|nr:helix-turn-helix domain-containing protein [Lachnospiraceae bacterium]
MENEQEVKFYSVAEVSKMLGISRSRAYEWLASPQCPFLVLRIGRRIIIPANNFAKWYESFADGTTEEN